MKKVISMLTAVAMSMGLAACGGSTTAPSSAPAQSASGSDVSGAASTATPAPANQVVIKFANVGADTTAGNKLAVELIPYLEELSGGTMTLEVYPNSALGDNRVIVEGIQMGTIEMGMPSTAVLGGFTSSALVFDLPFMFKDYDNAEKVLTSEVGMGILKELESSNIIGLGWAVNGWRHLTANDEIRLPEQMKGKKIRTMETQMHMDFWNSIGASATPMAFSELYTALQQGVVDCEENPYVTGTGAKLEEVQKYWIETGHIFDASPIIFSKVAYDKLTDEQKGWLQEWVDKYIEMDWQRVKEAEQEIADTLANNGFNVIVKLSDEEKQSWTASAQSVYDKYRDQIGADLIDAITEMQQ
ncbi:MAG: TRAP transporter substrate-binding protein DctP [Anaerotruncus sp.]|nr:TRAP transporter substrate-binding protein DctP [Anaerotruncus sp.]